MHRIVEQPTGDPTGPLRVSRRALLEGSASSALGAAAIGWSSSVIGPDSASAADSMPGGGSPRQMAAFRVRQTAAQAYLDEQVPSHPSNGDEARYPDKRASFAKTLPHNDGGEVDTEAFARLVSILSSGDPDGFEALPRDPAAEVQLNDPQAPSI